MLKMFETMFETMTTTTQNGGTIGYHGDKWYNNYIKNS